VEPIICGGGETPNYGFQVKELESTGRWPRSLMLTSSLGLKPERTSSLETRALIDHGTLRASHSILYAGNTPFWSGGTKSSPSNFPIAGHKMIINTAVYP
jgi:hypothetical protein